MKEEGIKFFIQLPIDQMEKRFHLGQRVCTKNGHWGLREAWNIDSPAYFLTTSHIQAQCTKHIGTRMCERCVLPSCARQRTSHGTAPFLYHDRIKAVLALALGLGIYATLAFFFCSSSLAEKCLSHSCTVGSRCLLQSARLVNKLRGLVVIVNIYRCRHEYLVSITGHIYISY